MERCIRSGYSVVNRVSLTVLGMVASLILTVPVASGSIRIVNDRPGNFIDIKGSGRPFQLFGNTSESFRTDIGNAIFPSGIIVISNNGGIGFDPTDTFLSDDPEPIPNNRAFGGAKALLPYWSDIGNHVGSIYAQDIGDRLIVQWDHKKFEGFPDAPAVTFQIQIPSVIVDNVAAQMLYQAIEEGPAFGGANGSVGYQDGIDGTQNSVQFAVGQAFSVSDLSILTVLAPSPGAGAVLLTGCVMLGRRKR